MKKYYINVIKGYFYGMFSIIPGLSGGALASYYGDYQYLIQILSQKEFNKKTMTYIFSLCLGAFIGIYLTSFLIIRLYYKFVRLFILVVIFINIVILLKCLKKITFSFSLLILTIFLSLIVVIISKYFSFHYLNLNISLVYIVSGIIYSISKIVPGVSSTAILINIGFYDKILKFFYNPITQILSSPVLWILFWFSFLIISLFIIRIVNKLINNLLLDYFIFIIVLINLFGIIF